MTSAGSRVTRARRLQAVAGAALLAAGSATLLAPVAASAHARHATHAPLPNRPKKLRVIDVTRNSFTVSANASAHQYRLYASTDHHHMSRSRIRRATASKFSKHPTLTIKGLRYTTKPYYFRVEARNGTKRRFSAAIGSVGLEPAKPTNLVAHTSLQGTSLTWNAGAATGFQVTQASDAQLTQNVHTYTIDNQDHQFSPPNLNPGTPYFFAVKALNEQTPSPATPSVSAVDITDQQSVRVLSWNLLEITADGRSEGGNRVAPWAKRRTKQVSMIKSASPDVMAVQEGGSWVGPVKGPRQVDDLVSHLGGQYALANTEIPPNQPHYFRTGCYILYKSSEYRPVGEGNHWGLGDSRWAAYQELQNKTTGAKFLFVAPHLMVTKNGGTDRMRFDETKSMVAQAEAYSRQVGNVPIVYAGDFNSDPSKQHTFNGPSDYLLSHGYDDSYDVASSRKNGQYDSANGYQTVAPAHGLRLDYIFTQSGIAVKSWSMLLNLSHHRFSGVIPSDHNPIVADLQIPYLGVS